MKIKKKKHGILIIDTSKLTIYRDKKTNKKGQEKTYYSYQATINIELLKQIFPENSENQAIYLIEKDDNLFKVTYDKPIVNYVQLKRGLATKEEKEPYAPEKDIIISYMLPKRFIKYLGAYDKYQDTVTLYNNSLADDADDNADADAKKISAIPIYADWLLKVTLDDDCNDSEINLKLYLRNEISYQFYNYVLSLNAGRVPSWLDILLTDNNKKTIKDHIKFDMIAAIADAKHDGNIAKAINDITGQDILKTDGTNIYGAAKGVLRLIDIDIINDAYAAVLPEIKKEQEKQ